MKDRLVDGGLLSTAPVRFRLVGVWNLEAGCRRVVLAHCWALGNHTPVSGCPSGQLSSGTGWRFASVGSGGLGVCELDSGREHLPRARARIVAGPLLEGVGWWCGWVCGEISSAPLVRGVAWSL